jgi:hypothetical protein
MKAAWPGSRPNADRTTATGRPVAVVVKGHSAWVLARPEGLLA